ncbi:MAG TPA: hypothetical protein VMU12_01760 [Candidatus Paceibacterota bacterium]|nr:hypothetical protein [Candidatus Paceibacterota bacterium]
MAKTFAELQAQTSVAPEEFMATLEQYAKNNMVINARVVINLIRRVDLDPHQKVKAHNHALEGCRRQQRLGHRHYAQQYEAVAALVTL